MGSLLTKICAPGCVRPTSGDSWLFPHRGAVLAKGTWSTEGNLPRRALAFPRGHSRREALAPQLNSCLERSASRDIYSRTSNILALVSSAIPADVNGEICAVGDCRFLVLGRAGAVGAAGLKDCRGTRQGHERGHRGWLVPKAVRIRRRDSGLSHSRAPYILFTTRPLRSMSTVRGIRVAPNICSICSRVSMN